MKEAVSKRLIAEQSLKNSALIKQISELQLANEKAETEVKKLNLLLNFHYSGYLVLDINKKIIKLNKSGAKLLEDLNSEVINSDFSLLICKEYRSSFEGFLEKIVATQLKQTCDIELVINNKKPISVYLYGLFLEKEKHYIILIKSISTKESFRIKLKENKFFFNEAQRLGAIGFFKINTANGSWQVSEMMKNIFGLSQDTSLNFDTWISMIHIEDKLDMELFFLKKMNDKTSWSIEYRIIRKTDGEVRWLVTKGAFHFNKKSKELISYGLIQDITNEKLIQENLNNNQVSSQTIFKSSKEGILILDAISGKISDANPSLIEMIGFNYEEIIGKELWEIGTFKNIAASKGSFLELQQNKYIRFENMPLETKAGKSVDVEFVSNVYWVGNKKVILCHIRDISDRKKIEESLEVNRQYYFAMFEKNQAVQLLIDPINGKIIDANSAAAVFYGYSLKQFKSMNLSDISTFPEDQLVEELGKFGLAGQSYFQFIHKLASGQICDIEIYTSPLLIGGKPYLISTINNITQRKIDEERLIQLNDKLKEVNALKSQFISTVSHEFRTPLAGIQSSVQLLQIYHDSWGIEKIEKMYKQIFNAIQQAKSLLDDVNLIDNEQNSESFFRPVFIDLTPLINEIIEENLAVSNTKHKVVLKSSFKKEGFFIDPVMVRHILNNLLSNAIKYSPEMKIIIITVDEFNRNELKITIKDQGIGIPKDEIKYLVEPFYRASNIGEVKGTGFGMSIVKRFVELHKGQLFFESILNKGTTVTIILPFKREEI